MGFLGDTFYCIILIRLQDTYAALKCMGDFAVNLKAERALSVRATALCNADFFHTFTVDGSNRNVNQKIVVRLRWYPVMTCHM